MLPRRTLLTLPETASYPNGQIPSTVRTGTYIRPNSTYGSLAKTPARCFHAMQIACQIDTGFWISYTGDPYRSLQAQINLLASRASPVYPGPGKYSWTRTYQGQTWYGRGAPVASPGTSNHGWAKSVDTALLNSSGSPTVGINTNSKVWNWMLAHCTEFGFCWESDGEPWHITYYAGTLIPLVVFDVERGKYPGSKPTKLPDPDPVNHKPTPEEEFMLLYIWKPHVNDPPAGYTPDDGRFAWFAQWSTGQLTHADQALVRWAGGQNPAITVQTIAVSYDEYQRSVKIAHGQPV